MNEDNKNNNKKWEERKGHDRKERKVRWGKPKAWHRVERAKNAYKRVSLYKNINKESFIFICTSLLFSPSLFLFSFLIFFVFFSLFTLFFL